MPTYAELEQVVEDSYLYMFGEEIVNVDIAALVETEEGLQARPEAYREFCLTDAYQKYLVGKAKKGEEAFLASYMFRVYTQPRVDKEIEKRSIPALCAKLIAHTSSNSFLFSELMILGIKHYGNDFTAALATELEVEQDLILSNWCRERDLPSRAIQVQAAENLLALATAEPEEEPEEEEDP